MGCKWLQHEHATRREDSLNPRSRSRAGVDSSVARRIAVSSVGQVWCTRVTPYRFLMANCNAIRKENIVICIWKCETGLVYKFWPLCSSPIASQGPESSAVGFLPLRGPDIFTTRSVSRLIQGEAQPKHWHRVKEPVVGCSRQNRYRSSSHSSAPFITAFHSVRVNKSTTAGSVEE